MNQPQNEITPMPIEVIRMAHVPMPAGGESTVATFYNDAMKAELAEYLRAKPYERNATRLAYSSGVEHRRVKTPHGRLALAVPQVRKKPGVELPDGATHPKFVSKFLQWDEQVTAVVERAIAEMYWCGVSQRRVDRVVRHLGIRMSADQVSRLVRKLDAELQAWRERPLGAWEHLMFDATYVSVREDGECKQFAVLVAIGLQADGRKEVLGVQLADAESTESWQAFMASLIARGLHGVECIGIDGHPGFETAVTTVFGVTPMQRCQVHLTANAKTHAPTPAIRKQIAGELRSVWRAANAAAADAARRALVTKYRTVAPKLSEWLAAIPMAAFAVYQMPAGQRKSRRTNNSIERLHQEVKMRTRKVRSFPNRASALRLITAVLREQTESWIQRSAAGDPPVRSTIRNLKESWIERSAATGRREVCDDAPIQLQ